MVKSSIITYHEGDWNWTKNICLMLPVNPAKSEERLMIES
jgi:hypothetical protein